jgi:cysteine synthase A
MAFYPNITHTIGHTPLIGLPRLTADLPATIALKCEFFNPLGSVKDRIGLAMIEAAERAERIGPGSHIVEPTSGNTGIALAFIAASRGYRLTLTMPETMSIERRILLSLLGAQLELTPAALGMKGAVQRAEEIWNDTNGKADVLVSAVGTGGTISGVSEVIKHRKPSFKAIAVEPAASPVITQTREGLPLKPGPHKIQGTGAGFIPANLNLGLIDDVIQVSNEDAIHTAQRLAREEGILAGISTGANVWAAIQVAKRKEFAGKLIITIGCSTGERYLSTAYADAARKELAV